MKHESSPQSSPEQLIGTEDVSKFVIPKPIIDHVPGFKSREEMQVSTSEGIARTAIGSFRGDPSRVPGHPAFEEKQRRISEIARSEAALNTSNTKQY